MSAPRTRPQREQATQELIRQARRTFHAHVAACELCKPTSGRPDDICVRARRLRGAYERLGGPVEQLLTGPLGL